MKTAGLVGWGSLSALALTLTLSADGCGGRAMLDVPRVGGGDAGDDSGSSGSSGGISGSSSGLTGSSSGAAGSSSGSSSGISGGSSGSGSGSGSGVPGLQNAIYLEGCQGPVCQGPGFQASAEFSLTKGAPPCPVTTVGSCTYAPICPIPSTDGDSAGTLTITGPLLMPPVTMTPEASNGEYLYTSSEPRFTAGQMLTASASGATVPAFGPVSVTAPPLGTLLQPLVDVDGGTTTTIDTSTDLVVAWTGSRPDATTVFQVNGSRGNLDCSWESSAGKGVVSAAILKQMAGEDALILYGQLMSTSFSAGPYVITLYAAPYWAGQAWLE